MRKDITSVYEQQQKIGYESEFIEGEEKCFNYMKNIFSDWQAKGITSILHEKQGGYSPNKNCNKCYVAIKQKQWVQKLLQVLKLLDLKEEVTVKQ